MHAKIHVYMHTYIRTYIHYRHIHACTYTYVHRLVGYAREQLVYVLAVIVKRRTLESDKKLLFDSVFNEVTQLLAMDPPKVTMHIHCYYFIDIL